MLYWPGYFFWTILGFFFYPIKIFGRENLPRTGGYILASNHLSNLDPMIIGLCHRRRLAYMAKDSLFKNKIFGWILSQVGAFPVKRDSSDIGAIKEVLKNIKAGIPVVLFPEGSRVMNKKQTHAGIGLIASKSQSLVVPVYLRGSNKVLGVGRKRLRRHLVKVYFGKPQKYSGKNYSKIASDILTEIYALPRKKPSVLK